MEEIMMSMKTGPGNLTDYLLSDSHDIIQRWFAKMKQTRLEVGTAPSPKKPAKKEPRKKAARLDDKDEKDAKEAKDSKDKWRTDHFLIFGEHKEPWPAKLD
eukprot:9049994-Pyramimonas_sp.AAC.1